MIDAASLNGLRLHGGFVMIDAEFTNELLTDAIGREAIARTAIVRKDLRLLIRAGLNEREMSVTLYHEILEALSVASNHPPARVADFNESDFERAAYAMHDELGEASPETLNRMLQIHGFREE